MERGLCRIERDLFDISGRLKGIDSGYFICFNSKLSRYEVHNSDQLRGTLALVVPYPTLDCRTVDLVLRTRCERAQDTLLQMEKDNAILQKNMLDKEVKKAEKTLEIELGK